MSELLSCPFCGGDAEMITAKGIHGGYLFGVICNICASRGDLHYTEDQAIDAWNSRVAYEMDDWFYLPKPKEQLFSYTIGFTFDDSSLKATASVDMYALVDAVRKWQEEELNQHIVDRICEVFKPERTCHIVEVGEQMDNTLVRDYEFSCGHTICWAHTYDPNYCPNCGARVIEVGE